MQNEKLTLRGRILKFAVNFFVWRKRQFCKHDSFRNFILHRFCVLLVSY